MSEHLSIIVKKEETSKIFDFVKKRFITQNTKKSKEGSMAYSKFLSAKLNEKYKIPFTVGAGSYFGKKTVSIYQKCPHNVRFQLATCPKKVKADRDIIFEIKRTEKKSCDCGKYLIIKIRSKTPISVLTDIDPHEESDEEEEDLNDLELEEAFVDIGKDPDETIKNDQNQADDEIQTQASTVGSRLKRRKLDHQVQK